MRKVITKQFVRNKKDFDEYISKVAKDVLYVAGITMEDFVKGNVTFDIEMINITDEF